LSLKSWSASEVVTDTNYNQMVNDVPSTFLHVWTPYDTQFQGRSGQVKYPVGVLRLRPVCGDYLHIRHEDWSLDGNAAEFWYEMRHSAGHITLWNVGSITATTRTKRRTTIDMTALTFSGQVIDVTGDEADLILYCNTKVAVASIRVYSGDASADADYGGT
jgi:hypothetical protein